MSRFAERLWGEVRSKKTPVMVGIDPQWGLLPPKLKKKALKEHGESLKGVCAATKTFCERVLKVVAPLVAVVKFQVAFFEVLGPRGLVMLEKLIRKARKLGLIVVLDGKRNDIGSTAAAYAQGYLGTITPDSKALTPWGVDAMTVNAFLGAEGIEPFLKTLAERDTGIFLLVRTSNPGAGELQDIAVDGMTIYQRLADWTENWSKSQAGEAKYGPVGAVVGATVPQQLAELRQRMPHVPLLIPGYGAQGGTAADVASAFDSEGLGAIVNNSRGILFAYQKNPDIAWEKATELATHAMIDDLAVNTPAGNLR